MPIRLQPTPPHSVAAHGDSIGRLPDFSFSRLRPALALSARAVGRVVGAAMPGDEDEMAGAGSQATGAFWIEKADHERETAYGLVAASAAGATLTLSRFTDLLNKDDHRILCSTIRNPGLLRRVTEDIPIGESRALAGSNNARHLIVIACIASLTAASGAARFTAGEHDDADDAEQPEWLWNALALVKLSVATAMEICGLRTRTWGRHCLVQRDSETARMALRSFEADFAVFYRLTHGEMHSSWDVDLLGGPVDATADGPFGPLWTGGEVPDWARPPSPVYAAKKTAVHVKTTAEAGHEGSMFTPVDGTDAYCVTLAGTGCAEEAVARILSDIKAVRASNSERGVHAPLLIVHAPDLRPELAGKLAAAGAYYLPGLPVGGTEPKNTSELCDAVAGLLGRGREGWGGPRGELPRPTEPSHALEWISSDPAVSPDEALRRAQVRYAMRIAEESGWPVGP